VDPHPLRDVLDQEFYTVREVSERLRVSISMVCRLLSNGQMEGFKAGRTWRIPRESLRHYIEESMNTARHRKEA
jgi:excisionase family DNA binding protein